MSIECPYGDCPHHSSHIADEGPFCHRETCIFDQAPRIPFSLGCVYIASDHTVLEKQYTSHEDEENQKVIFHYSNRP